VAEGVYLQEIRGIRTSEITRVSTDAQLPPDPVRCSLRGLGSSSSAIIPVPSIAFARICYGRYATAVFPVVANPNDGDCARVLHHVEYHHEVATVEKTIEDLHLRCSIVLYQLQQIDESIIIIIIIISDFINLTLIMAYLSTY